MQEKWFSIKQVITIALFIALLSIIGVISGKLWMIPIYALFFTLVVALVIYLIRGKQRHFEIVKPPNPIYSKVFGSILSLAAILTPLLVVWRTSLIPLPGQLSILALLLAVVFTLVFLGMIVAAVYLLQYRKPTQVHKIAAYALIVVASAIPGIIVSTYNRTTNGIGSVYYVAMIIVFLANSGLNLLLRKD